MSYIKLDNNTFAQKASPDPARVMTREEFERTKILLESELIRCDQDIASQQTERQKLVDMITEIEGLLE